MKDPFERAQEFDMSGTKLQEVVARIYARLPPEGRNMERVHFLNRYDQNNYVDGSTLDATCAACNQTCWVSPSSAATMADGKRATVLCMACVYDEARR